MENVTNNDSTQIFGKRVSFGGGGGIRKYSRQRMREVGKGNG